MTTVEYFRGRVGFPIDATTIEATLFGRGFITSDSYTDMTARDRELIYADLLYYGAFLMGGTIRRGAFSNTINNTRAKEMLKEANKIYGTYSDSKYDSAINEELTWIEYE